ncbi:alpha-glucosidase [Anianabacter salinae]|uniref:alpha-glucosidase n=1 Tax=Anianabacter salinae TaxID=2851023 RepID=UPI00225DE33C|nr:alpha-glucosidase [Anianabacter salinae]MBV0912086.1 DUF3459 domain-containing protein [Anianabacter salinae]
MSALAELQPESKPQVDKDWWRGAVIYQIYPRSYQDTNGDGIGDLPGITRRLPYIASLGVDAIWVSPFFTSPMRDFGYDVSDYCDVDPMFGTLADFDAMIAESHRLGLKVMIDLVLSHTSNDHPWFQDSSSSREADKADWYVWADPKPDGTPPNNWLSIFGGSAWEWDPGRLQYYLHNFLRTQPDLNFHCPAVQDALLDVARFWLERGCDGFRLDTVNFYVHDKQLRDNPPLAVEERNDTTAPAVNPYNYQNHLFDKTQPENLQFLERLRAVMDEYGATTSVGEVGEGQRGFEVQAEYTEGDHRLHMCYGFDFLAPDKPSSHKVVAVLDRFNTEAPGSWACWAFSNHDVMRHASRWSLDEGMLRALTVLQLCLRGSVCLYQGEELGLPEADVAYEDLQDPYGIQFWPEFKGRDGCRTPIVWEAAMPHGGFSDAAPWLPVDPRHLPLAVDRQEDDPGSMLHHYRRTIAFRRAHRVLQKGEVEGMTDNGSVLTFVRRDGDSAIFCAFNLGPEMAEVQMPEGTWRATAAELGAIAPDEGMTRLPAGTFCLAQSA